jgi:hypothetical protein
MPAEYRGIMPIYVHAQQDSEVIDLAEEQEETPFPTPSTAPMIFLIAMLAFAGGPR